MKEVFMKKLLASLTMAAAPILVGLLNIVPLANLFLLFLVFFFPFSLFCVIEPLFNLLTPAAQAACMDLMANPL
jgi:hypothetical protein